MEGAGFRGFKPGLFTFFDGLAAHQDRAWFLAHKAEYETQVRQPMGALVEALALAFAGADIPLTGDARRSLFRINRDVRFSADKRPYKTNAGAVLSRDGGRHGRGIVYLQLGGPIEPFLAAGFHMPESADLAALREAISEAPERWLGVEAALHDAGLILSPEPALQRMPKGFEALAGSPVAETLRLKRFVVSRPLPRERLFGGEVIEDVAAFATAALPLLRFGWAALERG